MKTSHIEIGTFNPDRDLGTNIRRAMNNVGMGDAKYVKTVECGRAVVIMPDSDRTQDAKPGEVMKMLGANESLIKHVRSFGGSIGNESIEMELLQQKNVARLDYTFRDTYNEENFLVRITKAQHNLLCWLSDHDFLGEHFDYENGHIAHDIEEI